MQRFEFRLDISAEQYLAYYRGEILSVQVRLADGRLLNFPAGLLRPFLRPEGIHGDFLLSCNERNRQARLSRRAGKV